MTLVLSTSNEDKTRRSEKRPWMLQDYLRDDVNSCSSNGFKSFPRRECCAVAVKNIIDKDFIRSSSKPNAKKLITTKSISAAVCRASMALINAVKLLPFAKAEAKMILPRSFSKKVFSRSFWSRRRQDRGNKLYDDEIERWISCGVVGSEKSELSDLSKLFTTGRNSDSWSSDITFNNSDCNYYLSNSSENDVVERREKLTLNDVAEEEEVSERGEATDGGDSVQPAGTLKTLWQTEEIEKENLIPNALRSEEAKKEQFSPISIMDFPANDEGTCSPFSIRPTRLKGRRERLTKRLERSDTLSELYLEPINLETLLCSTLMKDRSPDLSIQSCSSPTSIKSSDNEDEDEKEDINSWINGEEKNVERLLQIVKTETWTDKYELDNVLLDYFRENIFEDDDELVKVTKDWLNGHYDRLILGWEVKDKREAYIRDMEENGRWPKETKLQKAEVVNELQALVFAHLIEEVLFEFCSC